MVVTTYAYRWSLDEFLLAWEAGAFDDRAELIEGEVWAVPIGPWHGRTSGRVVRALPNDRFEVVLSSLPAGDSLPDPDLLGAARGRRAGGPAFAANGALGTGGRPARCRGLR